MFCGFCGRTIPDNAVICPACGARTGVAPTPTQAQAPTQPTYRQPAPQAPNQPSYQQPAPQVQAQPAYQQAYFNPAVVQPVPAKRNKAAAVLSVLAALMELAAFALSLSFILAIAEYYSTEELIQDIAPQALVVLCYVLFCILCLKARTGSTASLGIPVLISAIPTLLNLATWIFDFELFGVKYHFDTIRAISAITMVLSAVVFAVAVAMKNNGAILRGAAAVLLLAHIGFQTYLFIDNLIQFIDYSMEAKYYIYLITGYLAVLFFTAAMIAVLFGNKKQRQTA